MRPVVAASHTQVVQPRRRSVSIGRTILTTAQTAAAVLSSLPELCSRAGFADHVPNGIDKAPSDGDPGGRTAVPYVWLYTHPSITQTA
jgi:hypothetical protein